MMLMLQVSLQSNLSRVTYVCVIDICVYSAVFIICRESQSNINEIEQISIIKICFQNAAF